MNIFERIWHTLVSLVRLLMALVERDVEAASIDWKNRSK